MKILASDFDNTLYVNDIKTTKNNVRSINNFIKSGNIFCLITGRSYTNIKPLLEELNINYTYLICQDGAKIFNYNDECLKTNLLSLYKINKIETILKEKNIDYKLDNGFESTEIKKECVKIVIKYTNKIEAQKLLDYIRNRINIYGYLSTKHININDSHVNKKNALYDLIKIMDYKSEDLYTIGDDVNDFEMLKEFNGVTLHCHQKELNKLNLDEYETVSDYIKSIK